MPTSSAAAPASVIARLENYFEFAALGNDSEVDAILTVELDQHIVTAILVQLGPTPAPESAPRIR